MALTLYYGSGSPYAWRVQLALECKALAYGMKVLSFSAGDTTKPEFIALNPRHRVPVLTDGDFTLYESNAIVEYLDEAYPGRGAPLFPVDVKQRARVRRLISEIDNYVTEVIEPLAVAAFEQKPEQRDADLLTRAVDNVRQEWKLFTRYLQGDFLVGPLSAADFVLYPRVAFLKRCEKRLPGFDSDALLTPPLRAWKARIEALPYFDKTIPPHWKQNP
jgi:glutathione S-transferase